MIVDVTVVFNISCQFNSIHARHVVIGDDQVKGLIIFTGGRYFLQSVHSAGSGLTGNLKMTEHFLHEPTVAVVIVYDQDLFQQWLCRKQDLHLLIGYFERDFESEDASVSRSE